MNKTQRLRATLKGHLLIRSYETEDDLRAHQNYTVLLDQDNAVHRENAGLAVARVLADRADGSVYYMAFGNGGATVDPLGNVILNPPNILGNADLYTQTYEEVVDQFVDNIPDGNEMLVRHTSGTNISEVDIYCVIGKYKPQFDADYTFNEVGLKTADGLLLTHVTFTPITKKIGRIVEVLYTLTITVIGVEEEFFGGLRIRRLPGATAEVGSFTVEIEQPPAAVIFIAVGVTT